MTRTGTLSGDEARERLYKAMQSEGTMEERLERALEIGIAHFGVDHGHVTEIDQASGRWTAIVSTDDADGAFHEGMEIDLANTFCRRIVEDGTIALHDVPEQGWEDDPGYETTGMQCYHGAPVMVDGEAFGTACFAASDARADAFSEQEKTFTHLVARMAGHEIERAQRRAKLDQRETELDERREIHRATIDASFDLLYRIDTDGKFTYLSPATEEILGYAPEELVGESLTNIIPDEEPDEQVWQLFEAVLAGERIEKEYFALAKKDGEILYGDIRGVPIYDTTVPEPARTPDDIVAIQGMTRDATDRWRSEQLIRVLNRVLRHNLRNEASVINGYAEVLAERVGEEDASLAERIVDTVDRLINLSETARKLEQNLQQSQDLQTMDIVPQVRSAVTRVEEWYPDATITAKVPEQTRARASPRLETAVLELLDNAAKHAGEFPRVEVSIDTGGDEVIIRVTDSGPGLPDQERAVLERGEETPLEHGSGLGLWLVYWVVTAMEGDVDVVEDATIELRLPSA